MIYCCYDCAAPVELCPGGHSPVTVSLAYDHDRAMVTHGHQPPLSTDEMLIGDPRTPSSSAIRSSAARPSRPRTRTALKTKSALAIAASY